MRVIIAGGGIGGLTLALCLSKSGHQVAVLEQATQISEVGAGLQCGANAVRVFQYLGLQEKLETWAVKPSRFDFRDYRSGALLYTSELGSAYQLKYGAPYLHLHRADLIKVLLEAVSADPNIDVLLSSALQSYSQQADEITIQLSDGQQLVADLLVGCDGIKSRTRAQLLDESNPRFTGNVAWRCMVPVDQLPNDFMETVVTNYVGPGKHLILYYVRQHKLVNMVGVAKNPHWTSDSWVAKAPWEELRDDFLGWHPTVETVINAVDKNECYRWALYDHKPLNKWGAGRVTLLGDAAHATLPFMASGAAMAIEDARILQRCLDAEHHVEHALLRYQKNRISRTTSIQNTSRKLGTLYHINNEWLRKAAFAGLRRMGGKKEDFLPEYDANNVSLI